MKQAITTSLLLTLLISIISIGASADSVPARILLGTREAVIAPQAVYDGTHVLAPLGIVKSLGASYVESQDEGKVTLIGAIGQSGDVETVKVDGNTMLPMDKVMDLIGGEANWDNTAHTLTLLALVKSVEFVDDTLKINCSFPVSCSARRLDNKLIIDIAGAKIGTEAREVYVGTPVVAKARLGEPSPATARVVLDLMKTAGGKFLSDPVSSKIAFKVGEDLPDPASQARTDDTSKPASQTYAINSVKLDSTDNAKFNIVISTTSKGSANASFSMNPPQLIVSLPGALLPDSIGDIGNHPLLKAARCSQVSKSPASAKITLDLARILVYSVNVTDSQIVISVQPPYHSGGSIADKLIVIDAGHGGKDRGAHYGDVQEKYMNLSIARALADALQNEGAKTILTRSGDYYIGLPDRPGVAKSNKADFFISLHCNSNIRQDSASGIETYYHMKETSPLLLANAIHDSICSITGMCDRKARSDRSLYSSGLAVLRGLEGTNIPGVLVECGYINHSSDRSKLQSVGYQAQLAQAVVKGLKEYIGGTVVP